MTLVGAILKSVKCKNAKSRQKYTSPPPELEEDGPKKRRKPFDKYGHVRAVVDSLPPRYDPCRLSRNLPEWKHRVCALYRENMMLLAAIKWAHIEAERVDLEERYSSLQEENAAKTRKLKRAVQLLNSAKAELADQQREQQREMEGILDSVRALKREIQLADLVLHSYIPEEYQALIEQYVHWNEQLGEWQVKCVAYTGNNMTTGAPPPPKSAATKYGMSTMAAKPSPVAASHTYVRLRVRRKRALCVMMEPPDLSDRYLSYASLAARTRPASRLARPHTGLIRQ